MVCLGGRQLVYLAVYPFHFHVRFLMANRAIRPTSL